MLYFGNYALDPERRELRLQGVPLHVEAQVFDLLVHLIRNRERIVSKDDLIEAIWNGRIQSDSVLDNCIAKARRAIGDNGKDQRFIQTIKRKGARFIQEVREDQPPAPPADVPTASIEAVRATASADDTERQNLDFISERTSVLSDTTLRYLAIVDALALVGCVFARAPSALSINAAYILVFGPMLILLASAWVAVHGNRATGHWQRAELHLARILFSLPALTSTFLALQFFLLLAPPGECPTFLRWKYLTDFSIEAFKPEYCMGLDARVQAHGPWLMSPVILQAWFQVFAPIATAILCFRAFRAWHSTVEIREYTGRERN